MDTSREIRDLPTKIVREAGLEESIKEIKDLNREIGKEANLGEFDNAAREMNEQIRQAANLANQELLKTRSMVPEKDMDKASKEEKLENEPAQEKPQEGNQPDSDSYLIS